MESRSQHPLGQLLHTQRTHDIGAYGVAQGLWQMGYEAVHFVQGNDASLYCIDRDDGFAAGQTRQAFGQTNHAARPHSFYAFTLHSQQLA